MIYIFKMEYRRCLVYKSEVLFSVVSSVISILVQMALWKYLYRDNWARAEYMTAYVILSVILGIIYSNTIYYTITEKIANGNFALELLKPVDFLVLHYMRSLGNICGQISFRAVPISILFWPIISKNINIILAIKALPFIVAGHIFCTALFMWCGLISFVIVESWAIRRLTDNTISFLAGAVIPIAIFPDSLEKIVRALPFQYLYDYPIRIILGELTGCEIYMKGLMSIVHGVLVMWVVVFVTFRLAIRNCTIQGG